MTSKLSQNLAAGGLVLVLLAIVIGAVIVAIGGHELPAMLEYIGATAVGSLGTLVAQQSKDGDD